MEKIISYKAEDGTIFETEEKCLEYEQNLEVFNAAEILIKHCEKRMCCNCPFFKISCVLSSGPPEVWEWS